MNHQAVLREFSDLLVIGADALGKVVSAQASNQVPWHLDELENIAKRLREIAEDIVRIAN